MAKVNFHTAPTLLLKKYRKAVDQVAASICTSVIPGGLKSYYITLTDDEYAEHLARQALLLPVVVPVDGAPVIQPPVVDRTARPYPIQPNFPADNASEAAFRRYTAKQAIFITFANGVEELKQMIVESMRCHGHTNRFNSGHDDSNNHAIFKDVIWGHDKDGCCNTDRKLFKTMRVI